MCPGRQGMVNNYATLGIMQVPHRHNVLRQSTVLVAAYQITASQMPSPVALPRPLWLSMLGVDVQCAMVSTQKYNDSGPGGHASAILCPCANFGHCWFSWIKIPVNFLTMLTSMPIIDVHCYIDPKLGLWSETFNIFILVCCILISQLCSYDYLPPIKLQRNLYHKFLFAN